MKRIFLIVFLVLSLCKISGQNISKFIITDQFGYLPDGKKIAIIKNPKIGFDATVSFIPGANYALVNVQTGEHVFSAAPVAWKTGQTDASSGDQIWLFDFSSVKTKGRYYVIDVDKNLRSFDFQITPNVYNEVLKHAVRSFFYQRSGFPKEAKYAGKGWADGASHIGPLQDKNCRLFSDKNNPLTETDVSGGWYDAGDYNKYTNWTGRYVVEMMKAYLENPSAWGDDYNLPESGNSIPDLLDEARWGLDHLLRLQRPDGSVLCIVSESHASPPSSATGQSLYGPSTTSASLHAAAAFAISSKVYRGLKMNSYADTLVARALKAWTWADQNSHVLFHNNSEQNSSLGIGAGDQEEDDYTRSMAKLEAACYLFEITRDTFFRDYFDNHYQAAHLIAWNFAYPFEANPQEALLYYTLLPGATVAVVNTIKSAYNNAMLANTDNFPAYYSGLDPYMAHLASYTWGSNSIKSCEGNMYFNMIYYNINSSKNEDARDAALGYLHYLHGVNPLNMVYLSNMYAYGAKNCVNTFYHSWFAHGSPKWDKVGVSTYGPAPGYLTGGPNPNYNWASCCPAACGSNENNAACLSESISPPKNQPKQKSYKDFNTSWPLDSWEVTENSCGYQVNYIRLLSKFVKAGMDCNGDINGTAFLDSCNLCAGGNTGRNPDTITCNCSRFARQSSINISACLQYKSPSSRYVWNTSGVFSDTVPAWNGCDSIIKIKLTVNQNSSSNIFVSACDQYLSPSRKYNWVSSGNYQDTILNCSGCDSLISINLEIRKISKNEISVASCKSYLSPSGKQRWTKSGIYIDTLINYNGCDSLLKVNLVIDSVNISVLVKSDTLTASASSANYQWLDCAKDYSPVEGATNRIFIPARSGNYSVEVKENNCMDTSACYAMNLINIVFNTFGKELSVYPNPTSGEFTITLPVASDRTKTEIFNATGQCLGIKSYFDQKKISVSLDESPGIYFLKITNNQREEAIIRLVVN